MSAGFTIVSRSTEEVPFRARDGFRRGCLSFRAKDGFEVLLPERVVAELHALARAAAPNEFLGVLVGGIFRDATGSYAAVEGAVPVRGATATKVTVASTPGAALAAEDIADQLFPGASRLGWVHSHPRYGTRFSSVDLANQATYRSPTALGIVVDPWCAKDHGVGVYLGPHAERLVFVPHEADALRLVARPAPITGASSTPTEARYPSPRRGRRKRAFRRVVVALCAASLVASVATAALVGATTMEHARRLADLERVQAHADAPHPPRQTVARETAEPANAPLSALELAEPVVVESLVEMPTTKRRREPLTEPHADPATTP